LKIRSSLRQAHFENLLLTTQHDEKDWMGPEEKRKREREREQNCAWKLKSIRLRLVQVVVGKFVDFHLYSSQINLLNCISSS